MLKRVHIKGYKSPADVDVARKELESWLFVGRMNLDRSAQADKSLGHFVNNHRATLQGLQS